MPLRVAAIGECMIELSQRDPTNLTLAYGGDTLNTSVYLARCNPPERLAVDYVTALGDDPYSEAMLEVWRREGVGTGQVARLAGKLPGLYLIRIDEAGERRFFYYRSAAAARELFRDERTARQLADLPGYDLLYFSAITLSILGEEARQRLFEALAACRSRGGRVAFDTNYRPAGWPDRAVAQATVTRFLSQVDIALPTGDDERALFGDADLAATAARYRALGVGETVIKTGPQGCLIIAGERSLAIPVGAPVDPVDTTAAGDSFNAGYLSIRLDGGQPEDAARAGHRLAGAVICHRGAIIPQAAMPELRS